MAANTVWVKASDISVSVNSVTRPCTDCQLSRTVGEFDTTNLTSPTDPNGNIQYEGGNDVVTTKLSGTMVVDKAAVAVIDIGKAFAASFSVSGEQSTSGTIRMSSVTKTGSPKGAYQVKFEGMFVGSVTNA